LVTNYHIDAQGANSPHESEEVCFFSDICNHSVWQNHREKDVLLCAASGMCLKLICSVEWCRFCFVELANAGDAQKALQLSGQEYKGSALTIAGSQRKSQPEPPAKKQAKSDKAEKAAVQQHPDKG